MIRTLMSCVLVFAVAALAEAQATNPQANKPQTANRDDAKKGQEATITKVDAKNHTVTVKMKGKDGKETEKTFKLEDTVQYMDSTGKVAALEIFKSGDLVLVVEAEGHLKEMHKKKEDNATTNPTDKK